MSVAPSGLTGRRPRLLYVCNCPAFFASYRLSAATAALAAGYDVHVACPNGDAVALLRGHGLVHHALPLRRRSMNPLGELRTVVALRRLFTALRPDVVEQMTIKPVLFGSLAARRLRVGPVINWMAGLGFLFVERGRRGALVRRAMLPAYRLALGLPGSRAVFENPDHREFFVQHRLVPRDRSMVIEGAGVDMSTFTPGAPAAGLPIVLFAGRMIWDKGVREFVSAVEMLRRKGVAARFVMVGGPDPGNPASVDDAQLAAWRDAGVVEWDGPSQHMRAHYRDCSIFCFPTAYAEGVPRVLIEAAASGRPVITTDMPGCREVVRDGVNGVLVPPRDAEAVANAIERLLADPAACARMGARGREHVEGRFSSAKIVGETLALYASLASGGRES